MKISLVIPVYNEQQYLGACLDSVMQQVDSPDEVIVVDNNSTDYSIEIASMYPVRIIQETKQGMIHARNAGFCAAQYEIIARCDADAILLPDWIAKIRFHFLQHKSDALTGPTFYYDMPIKSPRAVNTYMTALKLVQFGKETMYGPNMALTKDIWNKVKDSVTLNDKLVHEDIDLAIHIRRAGGKVSRSKHLISSVSARRLKSNPGSFFIEYPVRLIRTYAHNAPHSTRNFSRGNKLKIRTLGKRFGYRFKKTTGTIRSRAGLSAHRLKQKLRSHA